VLQTVVPIPEPAVLRQPPTVIHEADHAAQSSLQLARIPPAARGLASRPRGLVSRTRSVLPHPAFTSSVADPSVLSTNSMPARASGAPLLPID